MCSWPERRIVALIAGPSGSGKSRLARLTGWPRLRLDDFYHDEQAPGMPRNPAGQVDWDDVRAWDGAAAADAIATLSSDGVVTVPVYSIAKNAAIGTHTIDATGAGAFTAEGIFAISMLAACRERGVPVIAIWLDRGRFLNWWRRLNRDVKDHRKPIGLLWRRGLALCRAEPALRRQALDAGFMPMTMHQARATLRDAALPVAAQVVTEVER